MFDDKSTGVGRSGAGRRLGPRLSRPADGAGRRWNWRSAARCRTADADALFVLGKRQRAARRLCRGCGVRTECLAHALDERIMHGMWGGMTDRERRALLRARPDVRSWADLLLAARDRHHLPR